jgi:hypothetical protein
MKSWQEDNPKTSYQLLISALVSPLAFIKDNMVYIIPLSIRDPSFFYVDPVNSMIDLKKHVTHFGSTSIKNHGINLY